MRNDCSWGISYIVEAFVLIYLQVCYYVSKVRALFKGCNISQNIKMSRAIV